MSSLSLVLTMAATLLPLASTGCGLIFGGAQKVDTKSSAYEHVKLNKLYPGDWRLIQNNTEENTDNRSDIAYEHRKNNAIISMNSVCGPHAQRDLAAATRNLLMGMTDAEPLVQNEIKVDDLAALQTVVTTKTDGGDKPTIVKIQTVVLHKDGCAYDLMYIAKRKTYETEEKIFDQFVKGFHVR